MERRGKGDSRADEEGEAAEKAGEEEEAAARGVAEPEGRARERGEAEAGEEVGAVRGSTTEGCSTEAEDTAVEAAGAGNEEAVAAAD